MNSPEFTSPDQPNLPPEEEAWRSLYRVIAALRAAGETMEENGEIFHKQFDIIVPRLEVFKARSKMNHSFEDGIDERVSYFKPANHQLEGIRVVEQRSIHESLYSLDWRVILSEEHERIFWECSLARYDEGVTVELQQYELPEGEATDRLGEHFLAFTAGSMNSSWVQRFPWKQAYIIDGQAGAGFTDQWERNIDKYEDISIEEMIPLFRQPE